MNQPMTPQERAAAALLDRIVGFIPMQPFQREARIEWLVEYAQETRRAALLDAAQVIPRNWLDPLLKGVRTSSCPEIEQLLQSIKAEIDRLAQEG